MRRSYFIHLLLFIILNSGSVCISDNKATNTKATVSDVQELSFIVVANETYSTYESTTPRLLLIETQAEWEKVWSAEVAGSKLPVSPAPEIDFQTQILVAAFTGQKTTGGYGVSITDINTNTISGSADVVVYANQAVPPAGSPVTQVITSPVTVVSVERNNNFTLEDVYMVFRTSSTGDEQIVLAERAES